MFTFFVATLMNFSDVQPILNARCVNMCHNYSMGDKDWSKEENVLRYKTQMIQKLEEKSMPPGNITNLTDQERSTLIEWLKKQ